MTLKCEFDTELRGERYADGGAGTEEVAEGTGGHAQLIQTCDRHRAGGSRTKRGGVGEIIYGDWQRGEIRNEIRTRIIAVKKVEKLDERSDGPTIVEGN